MMRQVSEYLEELPANMRLVIEEYYGHGKKYKAIANALSITPDAVRMQRTRGHKIIARKVAFV